MFGVELRQLALPGVLKGVGRKTLQELLARFADDLEGQYLLLPDSSLPDDPWFDKIASLLNFPA